MIVHYPRASVRYDGRQPVVLVGSPVGTPPSGTAGQPLGLPTTSARSRRGTWALYDRGREVVVVHPDGAMTGPPAEVSVELARLAAHRDQGALDRLAAATIQRLLVGDSAHDSRGKGVKGRPGSRRRDAWSSPAKGYWISGPYNQHGRHQCRAEPTATAWPARSPPACPLDRRTHPRRASGPTSAAGRFKAGSFPLGAASPPLAGKQQQRKQKQPRPPGSSGGSRAAPRRSSRAAIADGVGTQAPSAPRGEAGGT